ncbi:hypothetical protein KSC_009890 [Ktedonobacter sp. SOSP1-52]|uniref:hypothetical protein n=1 Tax=Ktedonobacter sp. SOSP1-52 TaxID=2778366 RepID=UPI0019152636|nr:hypothetical protein [Ktedonobacter sp. SOSP1-52]GHO62097.1 hypothetical protein KSC_009890 [Ktedonobacter sp. SOSP1-52]
MLAYVFWHQRASNVEKVEYQERLVAFHQILQERRIQGFKGSIVLEIPQLSWMREGSEVYEDWYLVENSAALDLVDEAAVSGICREPHNQVARLADYGTGGLYRLKDGATTPATFAGIRCVTWFGKPAGMSYAQLYSLLQAANIEQQDIFWQRQMTMGPALEFCVYTSQTYLLPENIESLQVAAQPLFVPEGSNQAL